MKRINNVLYYLHLFVGIGALFGGVAGMLDPYGPLGIPVELLEGSPFSNYFIPSLILFTVIGLGHIFSALATRREFELQGFISSTFSWALMIWIIVQCLIMQTIAFLHVLYFLIGLAGAILSARLILYRLRETP